MPFDLMNIVVVFQHLMNKGFHEYVGVCSFLADASFPKSQYGSVKMVVYFDIIHLVGNYMVVNEQKNPYENKPF